MPQGRAEQPVSNVEWRDRESLQGNDYNPNHVAPQELDLLETSIVDTGWTQPIVLGPDGKTIVDGFHRTMVSERPKVMELTDGAVPVVICKSMSEAHMIAATVRHNRARGVHGVRPMITLVQRLLNRTGVTAEELQRELGMSAEEVMRLSSLRSNPQVHGDGEGGLSEGWNPSAGRVQKGQQG